MGGTTEEEQVSPNASAYIVNTLSHISTTSPALLNSPDIHKVSEAEGCDSSTEDDFDSISSGSPVSVTALYELEDLLRTNELYEVKGVKVDDEIANVPCTQTHPTTRGTFATPGVIGDRQQKGYSLYSKPPTEMTIIDGISIPIETWAKAFRLSDDVVVGKILVGCILPKPGLRELDDLQKNAISRAVWWMRNKNQDPYSYNSDMVREEAPQDVRRKMQSVFRQRCANKRRGTTSNPRTNKQRRTTSHQKRRTKAELTGNKLIKNQNQDKIQNIQSTLNRNALPRALNFGYSNRI